MNKSLLSKLSTLAVSLEDMDVTADTTAEVKEVEEQVEDVQDQVEEVQEDVEEVQDQVEEVEERVEEHTEDPDAHTEEEAGEVDSVDLAEVQEEANEVVESEVDPVIEEVTSEMEDTGDAIERNEEVIEEVADVDPEDEDSAEEIEAQVEFSNESMVNILGPRVGREYAVLLPSFENRNFKSVAVRRGAQSVALESLRARATDLIKRIGELLKRAWQWVVDKVQRLWSMIRGNKARRAKIVAFLKKNPTKDRAVVDNQGLTRMMSINGQPATNVKTITESLDGIRAAVNGFSGLSLATHKMIGEARAGRLKITKEEAIKRIKEEGAKAFKASGFKDVFTLGNWSIKKATLTDALTKGEIIKLTREDVETKGDLVTLSSDDVISLFGFLDKFEEDLGRDNLLKEANSTGRVASNSLINAFEVFAKQAHKIEDPDTLETVRTFLSGLPKIVYQPVSRLVSLSNTISSTLTIYGGLTMDVAQGKKPVVKQSEEVPEAKSGEVPEPEFVGKTGRDVALHTGGASRGTGGGSKASRSSSRFDTSGAEDVEFRPSNESYDGTDIYTEEEDYKDDITDTMDQTDVDTKPKAVKLAESELEQPPALNTAMEQYDEYADGVETLSDANELHVRTEEIIEDSLGGNGLDENTGALLEVTTEAIHRMVIGMPAIDSGTSLESFRRAGYRYQATSYSFEKWKEKGKKIVDTIVGLIKKAANFARYLWKQFKTFFGGIKGNVERAHRTVRTLKREDFKSGYIEGEDLIKRLRVGNEAATVANVTKSFDDISKLMQATAEDGLLLTGAAEQQITKGAAEAAKDLQTLQRSPAIGSLTDRKEDGGLAVYTFNNVVGGKRVVITRPNNMVDGLKGGFNAKLEAPEQEKVSGRPYYVDQKGALAIIIKAKSAAEDVEKIGKEIDEIITLAEGVVKKINPEDFAESSAEARTAVGQLPKIMMGEVKVVLAANKEAIQTALLWVKKSVSKGAGDIEVGGDVPALPAPSQSSSTDVVKA